MHKSEIKNNTLVIDRWYMEYGTGIISNVKKTVFDVNFGGRRITYDYSHAQFLDKIESIYHSGKNPNLKKKK